MGRRAGGPKGWFWGRSTNTRSSWTEDWIDGDWTEVFSAQEALFKSIFRKQPKEI